MRHNAAVFILTHNRAGRVHTFRALERSNYTGPIVLLVDDEDTDLDEYKRLYSDQATIWVFSKSADKISDSGYNAPTRKSVLYARNECWNAARELGYEAFVMLDDDYRTFEKNYLVTPTGELQHANQLVGDMGALIDVLVDFLKATPFATISTMQSGDFIGGKKSYLHRPKYVRRKAMNFFACLTDRPFRFYGELNDDVNTYTYEQRKGLLFIATNIISLHQTPTQQQSGGTTDLYLERGTYVKSAYSVMYCPSAASIDVLKYKDSRFENKASRYHHRVNYKHCAPLIIPERFRKVVL